MINHSLSIMIVIIHIIVTINYVVFTIEFFP